jgi:mono/diheme cytochrome c family protein
VFRFKLLCIIGSFSLLNCGNNETGARQTRPQEQILYARYCKGCHGSDGTLMLGGAANLKYSRLEVEEIVEIIANGQGTMAAFSSQLTESEIDLVAEYVKSLRKN